MLPTDDAVLCRYHYDPLDRVAGSLPAGADNVQRFYQKRRLATEVQGPVRRMIFQSEEQLLAQHESGSGQDSCVLLATDQQRSVLHHVDVTQQTPRAYMAYGFGAAQVNFPGFNGEHTDPLTGHYLLGNGYRAFNPVLMRFNSPDSLSPFGKGGLNAYAYCAGDPVNRVDPTGHVGGWSIVRASLSKIIKMNKSVGLTASKSAAVDLEAVNGGVSALNKTKSASHPSLGSIGFSNADADIYDFVGFHGSTKSNTRTLQAGLSARHMDSSAGLSGGRGFYVAAEKSLAEEFAGVAASYADDGVPKVFNVYVQGYRAMIPGHHYTFGTMGRTGLSPKLLVEMEIVLKESIYRKVKVTSARIRGALVLPRASEAPF